jgi:hypothetical protein
MLTPPAEPGWHSYPGITIRPLSRTTESGVVPSKVRSCRTAQRVRLCACAGLGSPGSDLRWLLQPRMVAGDGRAFGACCFAGKLRSPAGPGPVSTVIEAATPTSFPTRRGGVPLASLAERISAAQYPFVGPVSRKKRG